MARLLLVSTAEKGHLHPLVGVAQHLRQAGHTVGWLCLPRAPPQVVRCGAEPLELPGEPEPGVRGGLAFTALVRDPLGLRSWIQGLLLDAVPAQVEPMRRLLRAWRPDAVGLDPMLYGAVIAAEREGLPYLGISSSLNPVTPEDWECELTRTVRALATARSALFATYGLAPAFRVCDALSPHLTTVFTTAAYAGGQPLPPRTVLVGPSVPSGPRGDEPVFPWERLRPELPRIYASFGSQLVILPGVVAKLAQAVARLPGQLVLNSGGQPLGQLPGHAVAVDYAPQLALLEGAAVMVSHGGANSVAEALRAGVPLLLSPVCNDQPLQARFLLQSGAGLALDLEQASIGEITSALQSLLDPSGPHRAPLARIAASYRSADGAAEVARLLAGLAGA